MARGYLLTVAVETPVLLVALSPAHGWRRRLAAGLWLTACTYPLLLLALPLLIHPAAHPTAYIAVGEVGVAAAESALFHLAFNQGADRPRSWCWRDTMAIVGANLASYGVGRWVFGS